MLQLRPNCEWCDKDLPPDSMEARICSYECTFCWDCVESVLQNVCPNCGGGLVPRPIRPSNEYRPGVSLKNQPAITDRKRCSFSLEEIEVFSSSLTAVKPQDR